MKDELRNNAPDSGAEGSGAESWKVSEIQQRDETSKRQVSVEQWQGRTTVKVRDVGRISAEHCVSELFGTVEIFEKPASQASKRLPAISDTLKNGPYNSPVKLSIQITNVPEVSLGVRNIDDLMALGTGIACGFKRAGLDTLDYLTTPGAVNSTLMQIGPALDNALNYYARTPAERVSSDGQRAAAYAWQVLENTIGHHLTPARSGEFAGAAMPAFFPIGRRKSLGKKGPQSLGIEQPFAETTRGEAKSLGLKQAPERITESHSLGLRRAPRAGGDWMVINERPSPDALRQLDKASCVAACGEMLAGGAIDQATLMRQMGSPAPTQFLARHLGADWVGRVVHPDMLDKLLQRGGSWATELREPIGPRYARLEPGHAVVVDGVDNAGNICIRDPAQGTRYEMTGGEFTRVWTGIVVFRK